MKDLLTVCLFWAEWQMCQGNHLVIRGATPIDASSGPHCGRFAGHGANTWFAPSGARAAVDTIYDSAYTPLIRTRGIPRFMSDIIDEVVKNRPNAGLFL